MAYSPPAFNNITIGAPQDPYTAPAFNNIIISLTASIGRRALFLDGGLYKSIPDVLLGTGVKPLVVEASGSIHPRVDAEGIPIVWLNGILCTLPESDYLII